MGTSELIHKPFVPTINELLGDNPPPIPPGEYDARLDHWETCIVFNKATKLILHFTIIDGEYAGVRLRGFYGTKRLIGKPRRNGRFAVGIMSHFAREFLHVMESRNIFIRPLRYDRLPVSKLTETPIKIAVRTVTEVQTGKLAIQSQYSVVDKMLKA